MSRHTPGPWAQPYFDNNPGDEGWWIYNGLSGSDEYAVAITFRLNPCAEDDARLIAAAPEMYEKGKALLEALGFPGGGWDMDLPGAAEVMAFFDALAKAEGWTP